MKRSTKVRELLPALLAGDDDPDHGRQFRIGWQERVRQILIDHAEDEALIELDLK